MANEYAVNRADLTAVADAIRAKGGTSDALAFPGGFVGAVAAIQVGSGGSGSGNAIQIGQNTNAPNFLNLFWALENGTAKTGEFTLASNLPNTETLLIDTGLAAVNGFFYVNADYAYTATGATPEYSVWGLYIANPDGLSPVHATGLSTYTPNGNAIGYTISQANPFVRGTYRIDGGKVYVTAQYNNHQTYTPFWKGDRYVLVAW